jgi:hypothetical protein
MEEVKIRWKEYIEQMYDKDAKPADRDQLVEEVKDIDIDCIGPVLLDEEIQEAIKELTRGKLWE